MEQSLWAKKGEVVTCINGHAVCEVACDLHVGLPRTGDHFTNWSQSMPDKKDSIATIRCAVCRGVWIRGNSRDGYQFHFGCNSTEGWR